MHAPEKLRKWLSHQAGLHSTLSTIRFPPHGKESMGSAEWYSGRVERSQGRNEAGNASSAQQGDRRENVQIGYATNAWTTILNPRQDMRFRVAAMNAGNARLVSDMITIRVPHHHTAFTANSRMLTMASDSSLRESSQPGIAAGNQQVVTHVGARMPRRTRVTCVRNHKSQSSGGAGWDGMPGDGERRPRAARRKSEGRRSLLWHPTTSDRRSRRLPQKDHLLHVREIANLQPVEVHAARQLRAVELRDVPAGWLDLIDQRRHLPPENVVDRERNPAGS